MLLTYLVMSPEDADVLMLDNAMDGIGADGMAIIEFVVGRSQARVRAAKAKWEGKHDASLVDRVASELHGANEDLALQLLKGQRDEQMARDDDLAAEQAAALHEAACGGWTGIGTDESVFITILAKNSPAQNIAVKEAYENEHGKSLAGMIASECSGNLKMCLLALLLDPANWFAMRLKDSFKGFGTSDWSVCRILGCHDKADVLRIAQAYENKCVRRADVSLTSRGDAAAATLDMRWRLVSRRRRGYDVDVCSILRGCDFVSRLRRWICGGDECRGDAAATTWTFVRYSAAATSRRDRRAPVGTARR